MLAIKMALGQLYFTTKTKRRKITTRQLRTLKEKFSQASNYLRRMILISMKIKSF
jgi:hypothetical protein